MINSEIKEKLVEIKKQLVDLDEQRWELESKRNELIKENSGYYIVNRFVGDGDYWDEYLYPIGLTTEEKAIKTARELNDDNDIGGIADDFWMGSLPPYFEVSKEQYALYGIWMRLEKAENLLTPYYNSSFLSINIELRDMIAEIRSKIDNEDVRKLNFIHVVFNEKGVEK